MHNQRFPSGPGFSLYFIFQADDSATPFQWFGLVTINIHDSLHTTKNPRQKTVRYEELTGNALQRAGWNQKERITSGI